ncbi:MAG: GNAT family N-acetyltransferase [Flavipsychrobacter sp.]|nr:GNAT family N-acetyltransferase [Flavipsychrobacter sp.]
MNIYVETQRLVLREIVPGDSKALFAMDSDPEVHTYLGNNPITELQQAEKAIAHIRQQYLDNGIGRWAVIERASGELIGWAGLKLVKEVRGGHADYYDVGYRFAKPYWGQGYATESALASVAYGFNVMKLDVLNATADTGNLASIKVLQKAGLKIKHEFKDEDGIPHYWFELSRDEWNT